MSTQFGYPILLDLIRRRTVVIGEFAVAQGKVEGLLAAGADVTVVATGPEDFLDALEWEPSVTVLRREYRPGDLAGAFLCVASSSDGDERRAVFHEAGQRGVLLNVMDDPAHCDWAAPALVRRGPLTIAISTGGRSPALARRLREELEERYGPEWEKLVELLGEVRDETLAGLPDYQERARRWRDALDLEELAALVREGRSDEARRRLVERLTGAPAPMSGIVYLVGAGPGDPRLLTLRGAEVLRTADVVVYDRLAPAALLDLAPGRAELVDAGKAPGRHNLEQEEINHVLVDRARRGLRVVRLKGGDPFVFGRGGEEALACAQAGIPFEVVPGVSAAIAAPAYAGIPVTHRGVAASVAVVTANLAGGGTPELARLAGAADTLVVLMAAGKLEELCGALVQAGRPPHEPAALIEWATTSRQRTVTATLAELPALAVAAGIGAPATLVVGSVVDLAPALDWFGGVSASRAAVEFAAERSS